MQLDDPYKNTYLVDDLGNEGRFKESELGNTWYDFPAGFPRISIVTFQDIKGSGIHFVASIKYHYNSGSAEFFANFDGLTLE